MAAVEQMMAQLERRGYKRTGPRRAVLAAVAAQGGPFSAAAICQGVEAEVPPIGRATVFRTLDMLVELGFVQRVPEAGGGKATALYLACGQEHHHHLICSSCHTVRDFLEGDLEGLIATVAAREGFEMREHRLELYGICAGCQGDAVGAC